MDTITEVAQAVASDHEVGRKILESVLDIATRTEPKVHSYVILDEANAWHQLDQNERRRQREGHPRPLDGVTVGVKDSIMTRDLPTRAGAAFGELGLPGHDAVVVGQLRRAGAIVLGKHVVHEFSVVRNEPPTRNAWDQSRIPGGSSTGSGVSVAVGSSMVAIGTDSGGSIRIPACINGVVGFKPTYGLLSPDGVVPPHTSLSEIGFTTRFVEDVWQLVRACADFDDAQHGDVLNERVAGMRLGMPELWFGRELPPDIGAVVHQAITILTGLGVTCIPIALPCLADTKAIGYTISDIESAAEHRQWLRDRIGDYTPSVRQYFELGALMPATWLTTARAARKVLLAEVREAFTDNHLDGLVGPTTPLTALPLGELDPVKDIPRYSNFTMTANLCGLPGITVPCGFADDGMPVGIQIIGRPFGDPTVIRVANAYQKVTSWHTIRPTITAAFPA